jgi:hypothetical protein
LHCVRVFFAVADHRSELGVDLLDVLAGLCIVGESTPFLFFSVPSIQI